MRFLSFSIMAALIPLTGARASAETSNAMAEACIHHRLTTYLLFEVPLPSATSEGVQRAESSGPGGFTGLLAGGVTTFDEDALATRILTRAVIKSPSDALRMRRIVSYRSTTVRRIGNEHVVRVAVAVRLMNLGTEPWTAVGGSLVGEGEELKGASVWQAEPIAPGATGLVVLEVETTETRARNTFTFELWDGSGARRVTLRNVSFP